MPLVILLGIWSISALNAIPGLAVSPILGQMSTIFPQSSEFDIQLLSSLPSLLTIPFILLSGKLTEHINNIFLLQTGLIIFVLSGLFYILSTEMWQLIAVSALLGIGSGLIVPLSTGLISRYFTGKYRTRQFGLSSAITNITGIGNPIDRIFGRHRLAFTLCRVFLSDRRIRLLFLLEKRPCLGGSRQNEQSRKNQCKTPHRPYGILRAGNLSGCHHQF